MEKRPPKIEIFELEQKFSSYCIRYRISGHPAPTKVWHLNGTVLDFGKFEGLKDKSYSSLNANGTRYAAKGETGGHYDGCLEIAAKSHFLSGSYRLNVRNELGEASERKQVILLTHPESTASAELDELVKGRTGAESPSSNETADHDSPIVLSISTDFAILMLSLLCTALLFYLACARYLKHQSSKRSSHKQSRVVRQGQMSLDLIRFVSFVDNPNYLAQRQYLKMQGINHVESSRIELVKDLGEGEFGRVYLGTISDASDANEKTLVAVKVLKHTQDELSEAFKEEAEVLSQIDHENIVKLHGISIDRNEHPFMMMIFEYMQLGDLNSFLRNYDLVECDLLTIFLSNDVDNYRLGLS